MGMLHACGWGVPALAQESVESGQPVHPDTGEEGGAGSVLQATPTAGELREAAGEAGEPDKHVVSQSRMFSVSGGDALRMGALARKADEIRAQVNRLLNDESTWKYAISIRLLGQGGDAPTPNPIRTRVRIIGKEPNLQIRIYPGGGIDLNRLTHAIISMVLFERAMRGVPVDALPGKLGLPPWLATGMQQAILWRGGNVDRRLYSNLFERSEMLSPQEILSVEAPAELDAAARQVYEVSCGVLIMSLLNRPNGAAQLRELVAEAVTAEGKPVEIISAHFIELGINEKLLDQWWALELAALSVPRATDALTPMETEERLAEALTVLYYDPETRVPRPVSLDDVYSLTELPRWRGLLRPCLDKLMELNAGCFPDYRVIILEYCRVIDKLQKGMPPDEVQQLLGPLREVRQGYVRSSIRGRDYLDWFEITHLGSSSRSADFAAYLETMNMLRNPGKGPDTAMGRYLEDIEALYGLEEHAPLPKRMKEELEDAKKAK